MERGDQADCLTFHSGVPYPIAVPCRLCHPRARATTAPQTLVLLAFLPAYEEEKDQSFLLATILDLNQDRTGEVRRWWGPVHFKALISFVHDTCHCCHRQELTDEEREKTISQSKWIYPLASQEELAVYPGMPNVQKIYLGKGSGKCMFLFYPK